MISGQPQIETVMENSKTLEAKKPKRVDINHLLAKVREEKKKENKVSLMFFGIIAVIFFTSGLILSF
tara:strand:- start:140 stop:340 length:201 start_codon:yes stop_codon:yes gene_type:complete